MGPRRQRQRALAGVAESGTDRWARGRGEGEGDALGRAGRRGLRALARGRPGSGLNGGGRVRAWAALAAELARSGTRARLRWSSGRGASWAEVGPRGGGEGGVGLGCWVGLLWVLGFAFLFLLLIFSISNSNKV